VDISLLDDDITQIDADTELDALICRGFGIALAHAALDRYRASDRFDDTWKLDQDTVAGGLDNPAFVLGYLRVSQLAPESPKPRQSAGFILTHQSAVPGDIARENGRQSTLDPFYSHRTSLPEFTLR